MSMSDDEKDAEIQRLKGRINLILMGKQYICRLCGSSWLNAETCPYTKEHGKTPLLVPDFKGDQHYDG